MGYSKRVIWLVMNILCSLSLPIYVDLCVKRSLTKWLSTQFMSSCMCVSISVDVLLWSADIKIRIGNANVNKLGIDTFQSLMSAWICAGMDTHLFAFAEKGNYFVYCCSAHTHSTIRICVVNSSKCFLFFSFSLFLAIVHKGVSIFLKRPSNAWTVNSRLNQRLVRSVKRRYASLDWKHILLKKFWYP